MLKLELDEESALDGTLEEIFRLANIRFLHLFIHPDNYDK